MRPRPISVTRAAVLAGCVALIATFAGTGETTATAAQPEPDGRGRRLNWRIGAETSRDDGSVIAQEVAVVELTDGRIYALARERGTDRATGRTRPATTAAKPSRRRSRPCPTW